MLCYQLPGHWIAAYDDHDMRIIMEWLSVHKFYVNCVNLDSYSMMYRRVLQCRPLIPTVPRKAKADLRLTVCE